MAKTNRNANKEIRNLTREEQSARTRAKFAQKKNEQEAIEKQSLIRRIFTIVVCLILILALGIPTMALTIFSQGS